jgi:RNA polymerase sigma-70 factor (ECF subfamily)
MDPPAPPPHPPPDPFRDEFAAHLQAVRAFLAAHLYDREDVADLTQEIFLAAYRSPRPDQIEFGAWLRGIARNKLKLFFRGSARRNKALDRFRQAALAAVDAELEAAAAAERADQIERLTACIDRLPDRLREVVKAGLGGDKPAESAARLGTTVGAVYALHYRANQLLRSCMKKEPPP